MSGRLVQLGLMTLISTALAAPLAKRHEGEGAGCRPKSSSAAADAHIATAPPAPSSIVVPSSSAAPVYASSAPAAPAADYGASTPGQFAEAAPSLNKPENRAPQPTAAPVADIPGAVSSAVPSVGSGSGSSGNGKKAGVAYNNAGFVQSFAGGSAGWCYNWGSAPGGNIPSGIEYVPTLWGQKSVGNWKSEADAAIGNGATAVMGFNEIDHGEQANMDAGTAASLYKSQITNNYQGKVKLVSPSVTNGGAPMGLSYLQNFMNACSDCAIDAINIHWYDSYKNTDYFKQHIQDAYKQFGKPIWLTEFGTIDGNDQQFLSEVQPWLDSQPYVERYAYFMAQEGKLIQGGGLSGAGKTYAGL